VLRKYSEASNIDLLREGNPEAPMVDVWTEVEAHHYFPAIAPIVYECVVFPARLGMQPNQKVVDESLNKFKKVLQIYEERLSKSKYLAGDFFSFADLTHFPYTYYFMKTYIRMALVNLYPHVKAWWEDLVSRPSVKKIGTDMILEP
jgi:glutathione S-transferase